MAKNDVFFSYSMSDGREIAETLRRLLEERGISVWLDSKSLTIEGDWANQIAEAIASCQYFVPIITPSYNQSRFGKLELSHAYELSASRSKTILPIVASEIISSELRFLIGTINCIRLEGMNSLPAVADQIAGLILGNLESERLYEKISEYGKLKNSNKEAETICLLADRLADQFQAEKDDTKRKEICREIHRLFTRLGKYSGGYDAESRKTVHRILKTLDRISLIHVNKNDGGENIFLTDLFFCAFKIQMIYLDREIRSECADVITTGTVSNPCPVERYIEKQKPYIEAFRHLYPAKMTTDRFSEEERVLIADTSRYIYDSAAQSEGTEYSAKSREQTPALSKEDEILLSIAHFMQEGNKLFDVLQKERMEGSFLRCLLTSYERLKAYCQVVGASDVAAECVDRILEIRDLVERRKPVEKEDGKAEKGIKSLLGYTLHGSGSYDVFISFKSEDSDLAETIYTYCQKHLKEPFWSKRSLPELSASEYEDAIFDALRKSKHFVVVLSKIDYLQESWVKKEMATFDRAITEGRKEGGNFLFVVTDDVYDYIIRSKKMCLDERYCGYQIIKMSEYESVLYRYLKD